MQRKTNAFWAKFSLVCALIIAGTLENGGVAAQSSSPSSLPLLSSDGLQYLGGFRVPADSSNGEWFSFGGGALAFNPANNSLFVSSYHGAVAELTIPAPVNTSDLNAMPVASYLQGFSDPAEGRVADISGAGLSGLMVSGNRLYGTASVFYDANNTQRVSHFSRSLQLNQPSFAGWSSVWQSDHSGFVSGWMTALPSEWQGALGGTALTGQCCVPIVWRTSNGPAALAFNPAQVGQADVSATPLLYYTTDHATLGAWEGSNPTYGATTSIHGMAAIAGTRSLLYLGRNGLGTHCYGNGTSNQSLVGTYGTDGALYCYDPSSPDKGSHAYPYRFQVWAYDLNDFVAVKAGAKQPWDVVPYGVWPINFPITLDATRLGGVAYDPQRQLLYVAQVLADVANGNLPVIQVFKVNAAPGTAAPAANTVSNVTLTTDKSAPQQTNTAIKLTAQAAGGVAPYQYKWLVSDGTASTVIANWTASNTFTWTPTTANPNYKVVVWVRSAGSTADVLEATTSTAFPITAPATLVSSVGLTANKVSPQPAMSTITWTATPVDGVAPHQYKWLVFDGATTSVAANWSTTNSFAWTPSAANANYRVTVWVRSSGSTTDAAEASKDATFAITASVNQVSSVAISANKPEPQVAGTSITWTATPSGGTAPFLYKWFVSDGTTYSVVANWASSATFNWTPSTANQNYRVRVWVKAATNPADLPEASTDNGFSITATGAAVTAPASQITPVSSVTLTSDKPSPQRAGTIVTFTAQPVGGVGPYQYQWSVFDAGEWMVGTWTSQSTFIWYRNVAAPHYQISVRVRSAGSTNDQGEATAVMKMVLNNGKG